MSAKVPRTQPKGWTPYSNEKNLERAIQIKQRRARCLLKQANDKNCRSSKSWQKEHASYVSDYAKNETSQNLEDKIAKDVNDNVERVYRERKSHAE